MIRVGSHSETLRPVYNRLNYDSNQTNDHVFNDVTPVKTGSKILRILYTKADQSVDLLSAHIIGSHPPYIIIHRKNAM